MEPIGPTRVRAARELLSGTAELLPASIYNRCSACAALVPRDRGRQHELWHEAIAVLAGRVFGPEVPS